MLPRSAFAPIVGASTALATFLVARTALIDDSYITLSYARNVAFHGTWGLLSDVPSATATSPLWVLVLAAATALTRNAVWALGLVYVLLGAGLATLLDRLAQRTQLPRFTAPVAAFATLVSPLLMSVIGMEILLLVTLFAAMALAGSAGRPVLFGLAAGGAFLTRMDSAAAIVVLLVLAPQVLRRIFLAAPVGALVAGAFMAWSWVKLGTAIPDTFVIKSQQHTWSGWSVLNGWRWFLSLYDVDAVAAFIPFVFGALALIALPLHLGRLGTPWVALTLAGLVHWLTLAIIVVPPYHWYYAPAVACSVIGFTAATAATPATAATAVRAHSARLTYIAFLLLLPVLIDVVRPLPWTVMPIQTNWATSATYDAMGAGLKRELGDQRVLTSGEIGHLVYSCDCVVDYFADPALLSPGVRRAIDEADGISKTLLQLNYRNRDLDAAPTPVVGRLEVAPLTEPAPTPSWPLDLVEGNVHIVRK